MHVEKIKSNGVGQIIAHVERTREAGHYGNVNIDSSRTHLNYDLAENTFRKDFSTIRNTLEKKTGRALRKDAVVAVGIVVQIPEEYLNLDEQHHADFFKAVHAELSKMFGSCCWSAVHMDEKTPHLHFGFIPFNGEQLRVKNYINRTALKGFHDKMDTALRKRLPWYHGGIVAESVEERLKASENLAMKDYKAVKNETDKASENLRNINSETARQAQLNNELKERSIPSEIVEKVEQGKRLKRDEMKELVALASRGADAERRLENVQALQLANEVTSARLDKQKETLDDYEKTLRTHAQKLNDKARQVEQKERDISVETEVNNLFEQSNLIKEAKLSEREHELDERELDLNKREQDLNEKLRTSEKVLEKVKQQLEHVKDAFKMLLDIITKKDVEHTLDDALDRAEKGGLKGYERTFFSKESSRWKRFILERKGRSR